MKGSLLLIFFFAVGALSGFSQVVPAWVYTSDLTLYALGALLFSVGVSIGHQPEMLHRFVQLDKRFLLLPLATVLGTWVGVVCVWFFRSRYSLADCLAIGSGFGYYSLSSVFIHTYRGAELGTIALLANIFREVFTLLFAPWIVRFFGPLAPISAGGATTMDTTFPVILQTAGERFTVLSFYHGFVVDFSVPFLVTAFCSLA